MATSFKKVLTEEAAPAAAQASLAKAPGSTFRGVIIGRDSQPFGGVVAGNEMMMTGWASFYVEVVDGVIVRKERVADPGPKNVAMEAAKINLVTKAFLANED